MNVIGQVLTTHGGRWQAGRGGRRGGPDSHVHRLAVSGRLLVQAGSDQLRSHVAGRAQNICAHTGRRTAAGPGRSQREPLGRRPRQRTRTARRRGGHTCRLADRAGGRRTHIGPGGGTRRAGGGGCGWLGMRAVVARARARARARVVGVE